MNHNSELFKTVHDNVEDCERIMNRVTTPLHLLHGQMFRKFFFFLNQKRSLKSIGTSNVPVMKSRRRTQELYVHKSLIPKEGCYLFLLVLMAS